MKFRHLLLCGALVACVSAIPQQLAGQYGRTSPNKTQISYKKQTANCKGFFLTMSMLLQKVVVGNSAHCCMCTISMCSHGSRWPGFFSFWVKFFLTYLNKLRKDSVMDLQSLFLQKKVCSPSPHLLGISLKSHFRVQSVKVQFGPTIWKRKLFFHCNYPSRIFLPLLIALGRLLLLRLLTYFTLLLEKLILVLAPLRVSLWWAKKPGQLQDQILSH